MAGICRSGLGVEVGWCNLQPVLKALEIIAWKYVTKHETRMLNALRGVLSAARNKADRTS
jgi:hypothetical protein